MRTFAPPPINDDSNCWHSLMEWPLDRIPLFLPCSLLHALLKRLPSWSTKSLLGGHEGFLGHHRHPQHGHRLIEWRVTSTGRHLPPDGCQVALPPLTPPPPPPKAGHLGRGECNLHAAAAAGSTEDRCQTLPITFTGQGDGAVLTRTRVVETCATNFCSWSKLTILQPPTALPLFGYSPPLCGCFFFT